MAISKRDKYIGSLLGAAIGDALGWPKEQNSNNMLRANDAINEVFIEWKRRCGGKYYPHEETVFAGEYSDDTQLLISTLRSVLKKEQWSTYYKKFELPAWIAYERGGGGATKRAAESWKKGIAPWDLKNNISKDIYRYFMAGGNGVAMRILPHVYNNESEISFIMKQVLLNGMYTHGHPRALIGALLYASAARYLISLDNTLQYGGLIDYLLRNEKEWTEVPEINNLTTWTDCFKKVLNQDYFVEWNNIVKETVSYLSIAKESMELGVLDIGDDVLTKIGCFDKSVNGAGNITAVASIYIFSKYASNPTAAIIEAANLKKADTDTIASMVGGLVGSLYGREWIPVEWRMLQDYSMFEILVDELLSNHDVVTFDKSKSYQLLSKEMIKGLQIGTEIEVLPFGNIELGEVRNEKCNGHTYSVQTYIFKTDYNQKIFVKCISKNSNKEEQKSIASPEIRAQKIRFDITVLQEITKQFNKVSTTNDFFEILYEIVSRLENNNFVLDKLFIDGLKTKWKCYKITKKQIDAVVKILKSTQ